VAGEDLDAGIAALRRLVRRGIGGTLNHVGTHVRDETEAIAATDAAIGAVHRIQAEGLDATLSIKLTQLGLDVDEPVCRRELRRVLDVATADDVFVRIDMEESPYEERTISLFEEMRDAYGPTRVGIVVQSYLRERRANLERLIAAGSRIRIVKGGYWEAAGTVYRAKADIDRVFARDVRHLLERGISPAVATHDPAAIAEARRVAAEYGRDRQSFEFQMLYGVRQDLQDELVRDGFLVRCYVPYGADWFVYFLGCVRRLPGGFARRIATRVAHPGRPAA
jgi:proline dehydrogenase